MLGTYIKSRGTNQGHQNVSKCRPHHSGDICTTKGEQFENLFFIYGPKHKKNIYFGLFGGGGLRGIFNDQTRHILLSSYPPTHIYVHVKLDFSVAYNANVSPGRPKSVYMVNRTLKHFIYMLQGPMNILK